MADRESIDYSGSSWTALFSTTPITGDDVYVGTDGSQKITTDLNQSAVDLNSLTFQHPSRLRIGSAAGALQYELSGALRWEQTAGWLYLDCSGTGAAPLIMVAGPGVNLVTDGAPTLVEVTNRGELFVSEDVDLATVNFYGGGFAEIEAKSGDDFALGMYGGQCLSRRNMTTVSVYDAELITEDGDPTMTTGTLGPGGRCKWSGGDITTLNAYTGCLFDAMKSRKPFTISTLNIADGAEVRLPSWATVSTTNYLGQRVTTG